MESLRRFEFASMGTDCSLVMECESETTALIALHLVRSEVSRLESKYSRFLAGSELSVINTAARSGITVAIDSETCLLLDYARATYLLSDRLFDITALPLIHLWRESRENRPDPLALQAVMDRVGLQNLTWTEQHLSFARPEMAIDFGGLVKEYAVDRCHDILTAAGHRSALIDLGGDIRVTGPRAEDRAWEIGVRSPTARTISEKKLHVKQGAIATSGDYERFTVIDGQRYCHIINPVTGFPCRDLSSVTVAAENCMKAGFLSTTAMLMEEQGPQWLASRHANFIAIPNRLFDGSRAA
ncbi:MAG: FAD:protein FMN transferase [Pirellulales bacterium]